MTSRSFVWLSIGGGAWGLGSNWSDVTDGTSPSAIAPGAQDSVTISGPAGASVQTITGPGLAAAALFTGNTLLSGSFSIGSLVLGQGSSGGLLEVAGGALQSGSAAIVSGSLLAGAGSAVSVSGTLAMGIAGGSASTLNATGGGSATTLSLFMAAAGDSIYVDPASVLEVGGKGQGRAGQLTVDASGLLSGQGNADSYGAVANGGTIIAQGGTLALGAVSGTGSLVIGAGATLLLRGACQGGQAVTFAGANATLALAAEADAPAGTLSGLTAGDAIDIVGSSITAASFKPAGQGGVLTLFYGNQVATTLNLSGSYAGDIFLTSGDGAGGTLITLAGSASGGGSAGPGTATPDQYSWTGGQAGQWNAAGNWADTSRQQFPAKLAPGANDLVTLAGGQTAFTVVAGAGNAAALAVTGQAALSGTYQIGTLSVGTGQAGATVPGTLDLLAGTSLAAAIATIGDGAVSVTGSLASFDVAGTLSLGGGPGGVGLPVAALQVDAGGSVQAAGLVLGGGSGDSIVTDPTGSVEVGTAGKAAAGTVTVDAGATLSGNGSVNPLGMLTDNGIILATGGTLSLGAVSGTGGLTVAAGATLELLAATAVPVTLLGSAASGGSVLAFSSAQAAPSGTITGFGLGDAIHLEGSQLTNVQYAGGTLVLSYGGVTVARLSLAGSFGNMRFVLAPDGLGGSIITVTNATGGGGGSGQTGTDLLAWTNPVSGAWGRAGGWTDQTINAPASAPPGPQTPVTIAGPGGVTFEDITGQGTCASLAASGNTILSGGFATGQLSLASGGALVLAPSTGLVAAQAILAGEMVASGAGAVLNVSGTLSAVGAAGLVAAQAHGGVQCATLVLAGGSVTADATASVEVGTLGGAAPGMVTIDAGSQASGAGSLNPAGQVDDNGSIVAQGGTLWLGNVIGNGALSIGTGATLALTGTDPCPVTFAGQAATLLLGGTSLAGTLSGFAAGDAIVIGNTPIDSVGYHLGASGLGTLSLNEAGQVVGQLLLSGGYAGQNFAVQPDAGGAEITVAAQASTGPAPGTTAPDQYVWLGGQGTSWATAANWQDVTAGQSPAATAPGLNNTVLVAGGSLTALQISGPANAASLALTGTVALLGAFSVGTLSVGQASGGAPGVLALAQGGAVSAGTGAVIGGVALSGGALSVSTTLTLGQVAGAGGVLAASGTASVKAGALLLMGNASAVTAASSAIVEIGGSGGGSAGDITVDAGGMLAGAGSLAAAMIIDQGTITASGGTLLLSSVSGTGVLEVGSGAELALGGTASAGLVADFAGAGTLSLGQGALAGAPAISGFGTGDQILLSPGGATAALYAQTAPGTGTVSILSGSQVIAQLTLLGNQAGRVFSVTGSAGGGTILTTGPDRTSGQGGSFVTNPTTSGGFQITSSALEANLESTIPYAIADLSSLLGNTTTYEWFSADGLTPGAASLQDPSVEVVGPLQAGTGGGNGPGFQMAMQAGYTAVLLEGQENVQLTDGGLGGALLAGNYGSDELAALGTNDTLVGATGANTTFYASLAAGAQGSASGHDVVIRGGGNDTIATNNDAAAITTSFGHSEVFLGAPQNFGTTNDVTLDGSDTVVCGGIGGATEDNVTVNAAAGLGGNLAYGPSAGVLHFVGGNTASTVVGTGGQVLMQGGSANGNVLWAGSSAVNYVGGSGSAAIVGGSAQTYVQGGTGPVTVFGGTGSGVFSGAAGSAFVVGDGASTVTAAAGDNVYITGGANVSVAASTGADVYAGSSTGNDIFQAGAGAETLWGGLGNDLFLAGSGHSLMVGGGGADVFSFLNGANSGGSDTIVGFVPGQSTIELSGYGSTAPQITYAYGDSILNLQDGSQIVVYNVANLTAASITLR